MANPVIPRGLKPVIEGYSIGDPGGVFRTEVGGGMPRAGLAWDRGVQAFRVTLIVDALAFSVWTAFYFHVIKKGAIQFDMQLDSGFGVKTHSVQIIPGSYSVVRNGAMSIISFSVEAESSAYDMSAADAAAYIDIYNEVGAESPFLLERIAQFANKDTLVLDF